jgi:hypothetical protein
MLHPEVSRALVTQHRRELERVAAQARLAHAARRAAVRHHRAPAAAVPARLRAVLARFRHRRPRPALT